MPKKFIKNAIIIFLILIFSGVCFLISKSILENNKEIEKIVSIQKNYNEITNDTLKESIMQAEILNPKEKESILHYVDDNYYAKINGYLRGELQDIPQFLKDDIKIIDFAFKKAYLPENTLLYRSVKDDFIEKVFKDKEIAKMMKKNPSYNAKNLKKAREFLLNKTFTELGYMSTSYNKYNIYRAPIMLTINAPKGIKALALEDITKGNEQEILMNRGYKWKITEVLYSKNKVNKRVWEITLEFCPD